MILRVAVGISGGVDSTVSALLLSKRRKQFEVIGTFMKNWDTVDETGHCRADKEAEEAEDVCKRIGIPFKHVTLVKEYWNEVFEPFVRSYEAGFTPNPDIICNSRIKFAHFHRHCVENLGCDAIATGHYARTSWWTNDLMDAGEEARRAPARLLKAKDLVKDQTFFLSQEGDSPTDYHHLCFSNFLVSSDVSILTT
jgi:tRNA-specific 2-thiouridylase